PADAITKRLANDHVAFVAFLNDTPAAFGWMARGKAIIGELDHELILPIGHRYLWNFRTMEPFRGFGIYPALLQYIIQYESSRAERFWIIHAPENKASLHGIRKAGWQYLGKLYSKNGKTVMEGTHLPQQERSLLHEMGITISDDEPVSCWNCSSPYLRKRKKTCCCSLLSEPCVGHNHAVFI
ncbi:MAG TPA: hypothetical protein VK907_08645, partial [Phnomibacter sp.]|nr:hypothetical protein [Phnomibacter sp.]